MKNEQNSEPLTLNGPTVGTRDWFAGMALQGLLASRTTKALDSFNFVEMASLAYQAADAMIQEREKK